MQDYATQFLGKTVNVIVDRPIGTKHLKHDCVYTVNYGHIEGTEAPDGEEVDAYILGVFDPVQTFFGKCIAVVHRQDEDDDKVVAAPEGVDYSDEQILALVEFQERFHQSVVARQGKNK